MNLNRRRLRQLLLSAAAVLSVMSALGALARQAWWLELFSHFRPQYALSLAAIGMALLFLRPRLLGALCLLVAGMNAWPLAHYLRAKDTAFAGGQPFRAVLANVYYRNSRPERLLAFVRAEQPDFAVFLEVTPAWEQALAGLADLLPYQARSGELLVASRRPLDGLRPVALASSGAGTLVWSEAGLTVIGGHANWPLGPRIAASRDEELRVLAALARSLEGPVLLLADLNVTAFSPAFDDLLARSRLADCSAGRGWHPTWPALFPPAWLQIDHCLHSVDVAVDHVRTGPWNGSDHYPVVIEGRLTAARDR